MGTNFDGKTGPKEPFCLVLKSKGITQKQLADTISYSETYVSLVRHGKEKPSRRFRDAVARYLGMPESLLFHEAKGRDVARAREDAWTTAPHLTEVPSEDRPRSRGSYLEPVR